MATRGGGVGGVGGGSASDRVAVTSFASLTFRDPRLEKEFGEGRRALLERSGAI